MYVYKVLILIKSSFKVCIDSEAGRCNMYENCKSTEGSYEYQKLLDPIRSSHAHCSNKISHCTSDIEDREQSHRPGAWCDDAMYLLPNRLPQGICFECSSQKSSCLSSCVICFRVCSSMSVSSFPSNSITCKKHITLSRHLTHPHLTHTTPTPPPHHTTQPEVLWCWL